MSFIHGDFVIVHRDRSEEPDSIYPCDGRLSACVTLSINYSLGYLLLPRVRGCFVKYADAHSRFEHIAWYRDPVHGYKNTDDLVSGFITTVLAEFFLICIDSTMTNPNSISGVANRAWRGRFSARDHCISLNAAVRERPSSPRPYCSMNAKDIIESW